MTSCSPHAYTGTHACAMAIHDVLISDLFPPRANKHTKLKETSKHS